MRRHASCALLLGLVLTAGCRRAKAPAQREGAEAGGPAPVAEEDLRWKPLRKRLARAEAVAAEVTFEGLPGLIGEVRTDIGRAREARAPFTGRLESILDDLRARLRKEAEARLKRVLEAVAAKLKVEDYAAAYDTLAQFEEAWGRYAAVLRSRVGRTDVGREILERVRREKARVRELGDAETWHLKLVDPAKTYAATDPGRAVAYLEGYPEAYRKTKYGREVESLIAKYYAAYTAQKKPREIAADIPFEDIPVESAQTHPAGEGVWSFEGGELRAANSTAGQAIAEIGRDTWIDFVVEFEAKQEEGKRFWVGARAEEDRLANQLRYQFQPLEPPDAEWHRYRTTVQGPRLESFLLGRGEEVGGLGGGEGRGFGGIDLRGEAPSRFAIAVDPGSKLALRNVRAKVIRAAKEEGAEEGGEEAAP